MVIDLISSPKPIAVFSSNGILLNCSDLFHFTINQVGQLHAPVLQTGILLRENPITQDTPALFLEQGQMIGLIGNLCAHAHIHHILTHRSCINIGKNGLLLLVIEAVQEKSLTITKYHVFAEFEKTPVPTSHLTNKESVTLKLLNDGLSVKAIALELRVTHHTVAAHMKAIYRKLSVNSRGEACVKYRRNGATSNSVFLTRQS